MKHFNLIITGLTCCGLQKVDFFRRHFQKCFLAKRCCFFFIETSLEIVPKGPIYVIIDAGSGNTQAHTCTIRPQWVNPSAVDKDGGDIAYDNFKSISLERPCRVNIHQLYLSTIAGIRSTMVITGGDYGKPFVNVCGCNNMVNSHCITNIHCCTLLNPTILSIFFPDGETLQ